MLGVLYTAQAFCSHAASSILWDRLVSPNGRKSAWEKKIGQEWPEYGWRA